MTQDESQKFAECFIDLVVLNDGWNLDSTLVMLRLMRHPKIFESLNQQAEGEHRQALIAMGLSLSPLHPDEEEDDVAHYHKL